MTDYIYLVITTLAGLHAFTYARWLSRQGNRTGAFGVLALIMLGLAVSVYRLAFMS